MLRKFVAPTDLYPPTEYNASLVWDMNQFSYRIYRDGVCVVGPIDTKGLTGMPDMAHIDFEKQTTHLSAIMMVRPHAPLIEQWGEKLGFVCMGEFSNSPDHFRQYHVPVQLLNEIKDMIESLEKNGTSASPG